MLRSNSWLVALADVMSIFMDLPSLREPVPVDFAYLPDDRWITQIEAGKGEKSVFVSIRPLYIGGF